MKARAPKGHHSNGSIPPLFHKLKVEPIRSKKKSEDLGTINYEYGDPYDNSLPSSEPKTLGAMFGFIGIVGEKRHNLEKGTRGGTYTLTFLCIMFTAFIVRSPNHWFNWAFFPHQLGLHYGLNWPVSLFIHLGWPHAIGNIYFLFFFGRIVESQIGKINFLILFFASGFFGHFLYLLAGSHRPSLGASGAIFGIMLYFSILNPKTELEVKFLNNFYLKTNAFLLIALYVVLNFIMALAGNGAQVNYLAHLGGALGGLLCSFILPNQPKLGATNESESRKYRPY